MTAPRTVRWPDDDALLADLTRVLSAVDPVPVGLVERVHFALDIEHLDVGVARWEEQAGELVGVRGSATPTTVTFTVDGLSVMVAIAGGPEQFRVDGWLVPSAPCQVEVRVQGQATRSTVADDGGRFVLTDVPGGAVQFVVRQVVDGEPARTVVTPAMQL